MEKRLLRELNTFLSLTVQVTLSAVNTSEKIWPFEEMQGYFDKVLKVDYRSTSDFKITILARQF
jgi:hypothetical protein